MTNPVPEPSSQDNQSGDRTAEIRARLAARNSPRLSALVAARISPEDAALMANASADLSWLLAEVDAARERVAILRAEIRDLEGIIGIASPHGNDDPKWAAYQDSLEVREQLRKANEFIIASELLSKDIRGEA